MEDEGTVIDVQKIVRRGGMAYPGSQGLAQAGLKAACGRRSAMRSQLAPRQQKWPPQGAAIVEALRIQHLNSSGGGDVANRDLAGATVFLRVEGDLLAFAQPADASALERGRMDEHVLAAVIRLDEAEALLVVVEFHCASLHCISLSLVQIWFPHADRVMVAVRRFLEVSESRAQFFGADGLNVWPKPISRRSTRRPVMQIHKSLMAIALP
jgi:hypothetical protein